MAKDCGCNKGKAKETATGKSVAATKVKPKTEGIITKKTCPKCNYWMSMTHKISTNERTFVCQNLMCKYSMPYSSQA